MSIWRIAGPIALGALAGAAMIAFGNENMGKAGFLIIGALLAIITSVLIEIRKRQVQVRDTARVLYAELTHLVARCVFDSEWPWKGYWPKDAAPGLMSASKLRKFAPATPTIFGATASQLALLPGKAPQTLIEFHYRLSALRREIENTVASASPSDSANVPIGALRLVGLRFRQTLEPGRTALEALAPLVPDSAKMEEHARISYYETRTNSDLTKALSARIDTLLAEPFFVD
ncbi:hypothetical protein [Bradyrhizobium quebecense]|uniref:Uncharacterized protein n=2 Tax=Bradyrhizobium quebecense TaxID=2748629 RepID=A0ACD3V9E7_9BRAD|nr:hypothetical protein [Bradyrhizobium quebecense]UGY03123.1 hypothetical protein J4P68_0039775 [Bradyrhizobium quebecense]